jgi:hypothetical protein
VIRNAAHGERALDRFLADRGLRARGAWSKEELVALFDETLPEFAHLETGKYLDDRM